MLLIFVLALLLFGPKKLPELGRMLGKAFSEFRRAKNEIKNTFDMHMRELEREARLEEAKKQTPKLEAPSYQPPSYEPPSYSYSYPYDDTSYEEASSSSPYSSSSAPHDEPIASPAPLASPTVGTIARSNGVAPLVHEEPVHSGSEATAENQAHS
jgi:TatA/E family protein of Tat protein translocase